MGGRRADQTPAAGSDDPAIRKDGGAPQDGAAYLATKGPVGIGTEAMLLEEVFLARREGGQKINQSQIGVLANFDAAFVGDATLVPSRRWPFAEEMRRGERKRYSLQTDKGGALLP